MTHEIDFDHQSSTNRGFRIYSEFADMYDQQVYVVESSGVNPGIWIQMKKKENVLLSPEQCRDLAIVLLRASQEKEGR